VLLCCTVKSSTAPVATAAPVRTSGSAASITAEAVEVALLPLVERVPAPVVVDVAQPQRGDEENEDALGRRDAGNRVQRRDESRRLRHEGENQEYICHVSFIA